MDDCRSHLLEETEKDVGYNGTVLSNYLASSDYDMQCCKSSAEDQSFVRSQN